MNAATKTVPVLPPGSPAEAGHGRRGMKTVTPQAAEEAGLASRVLVDPRVWDDCVAWTEADTARKGIDLDESIRLADLLQWAVTALKRDSAQDSGAARPGAVPFTVERVPRAGTGRTAEKVTLTVTPARTASRTVTLTIAHAPAGCGAAVDGAR